MRVLVVDTNRWYARKVKETIEELAPSVQVETASNLYEVQSRFDENPEYHLILADIRFSSRYEDMAKLLDTSPALKIIWSAVESFELSKGESCQAIRIQKPISLLSMKRIVEQKILPAAQVPA